MWMKVTMKQHFDCISTYIINFPSLLFTVFSTLPTPNKICSFNFYCLYKLLIAFDGCEISCINFMPFWKFAKWPFKLVFCIHLERLEGWMQKMLVKSRQEWCQLIQSTISSIWVGVVKSLDILLYVR